MYVCVYAWECVCVCVGGGGGGGGDMLVCMVNESVLCVGGRDGAGEAGEGGGERGGG